MLGQLADEHVVLYLLLICALGAILTLAVIFLVHLVVTLWSLTQTIYWFMALGGGL